MDRKNANSKASRKSKPGDRPSATSKTPFKTLVVINPSIQDHQALASEFLPDAKILLLDPQRDGVQQITEALQQNPELTHVHIFSDGSCEQLNLGNAHLSLDTLEYYAWDLQTWFPAHAFVSPSVRLHGCGAAVRETEFEFINRLRQLTGANVDIARLVKCCASV